MVKGMQVLLVMLVKQDPGQKTMMLICFLLAQSTVLYATKQMKLQHKLRQSKKYKKVFYVL